MNSQDSPQVDAVTTVEYLRTMRDMLAKGWTQKTCARDQHGTPVPSLSDDACQFCLMGAHSAAYAYIGGVRHELLITSDNVLLPEIPKRCYQAFSRSWSVLVDKIRSIQGHCQVPGWNDAEDRTQAEVLALMDELIGEAEEDEKCATA